MSDLVERLRAAAGEYNEPDPALVRIADDDLLRQAADRIEQLTAALREISYGEGAYSKDPLEHAANCIDNMKDIAIEALKDA